MPGLVLGATVIWPVVVLKLTLPALGAGLVSVACGMLAFCVAPGVMTAETVVPLRLTVSLAVTGAVVVPLAGTPG